jgi:hypothetical protein
LAYRRQENVTPADLRQMISAKQDLGVFQRMDLPTATKADIPS